jgi:hypothetical protein
MITNNKVAADSPERSVIYITCIFGDDETLVAPLFYVLFNYLRIGARTHARTHARTYASTNALVE